MDRIVIGVAGGSGSGKTTVVREIIRSIGEFDVSHIQHDSYYCDRSHLTFDERAHLNYDHPDALETSLLVEHVLALKAGHEVDVPVYNFSSHTREDTPRRLGPERVILIEGILILADQELRDTMDIRVFVDTDPDIRILRRIRRDTAERGRSIESVVNQYLRTVRPMHLEFVEPSKRHAHVIIPEGGRNEVAVDMLITKIRSILQR